MFEYGYSIDIKGNQSYEKGAHLVNYSWGGEGCSGYHHTDEAKIKISNSLKGENSPFYGITLSSSHKQKLSKAKIGNNYRSKSVICITTRKIFKSAKEASEYYDCKSSEICLCCSKKNYKSAGKLSDSTPLVWRFYEDYLNMTENEIKQAIEEAKNGRKGKNAYQSRAVICITNGKIFFTAKEASEYYNCNRGNISNCCKGKRKFCGKLSNNLPLQWMYLDEFLNKCKYTKL